jgi:hypothetical protein
VQSKNKPAPTVAEREHIERLRETGVCIVCGGNGEEIHEPEQGMWFISVLLCAICHRDPKYGWHGQRLNWKARKWGILDAINATVRLLMGHT